tara:strand:- start:20189 stop:21208 length:1020 start_codon:yes stop_codon:yes gene_type:complete
MERTQTTYRQVKIDSDEQIILDALLLAGDTFVSGTRLAERLGVSRPAIKGKLEKLRTVGFDFEAVRNRGYRLTKITSVLHPGLLQHHLSTPIDILYFPVVDSTNSEAERLLSYGQKCPFVVTSSCQTNGRGRMRRDWYSASADNLYLSVVFEPNSPPQILQHFTLNAAIFLCKALQKFVPSAPLKIKWPNDLHCEGRKFAGMLTEAKMDADGLKALIFGIGININSNPMELPKELRQIATSLYAIKGRELPINLLTTKVIEAIYNAYDSCLAGHSATNLKKAWGCLDSLHDKFVCAEVGDREISGIARGIDEQGALLIDCAGHIERVLAGDVHLKKSAQ